MTTKATKLPWNPEAKIVRVLSVIDTRQFEEISDGVFKPIAGSGNVRECSRCCREHEVHAEVLLDDGKTAIVGTGCMGKGSMLAKKLAAGARNATKRAKLAAELATAREQVRLRDRVEAEAEAEVARLPLPPFRKTQPGADKHGRWRFDMGDFYFYSFDKQPDEAYFKQQLTKKWRGERAAEIMARRFPGRRFHYSHRDVELLEDQLAKLDKKLASL